MINKGFTIREQLVKPVMKSGNGGAVWVPRDWLGQEVIVILPERSQVNLNQRILQNLGSHLKDVVGVYLYGSYARQEQTSKSDIDVLVVTKEKTFQINEQGLEFTVLPLERLKNAIRKNPEMYYTMIKESQAIINISLLEELQKIKPDKEAFAGYIKQTKEHLKSNKQLLALDKQDGNMLKSDAVIYSVMLRLRGVFIIQCILYKKIFSKLAFRRWLESKGIGRKEFQELYQGFSEVRDDKRLRQKISIELAGKLTKVLEEETTNLEEKI